MLSVSAMQCNSSWNNIIHQHLLCGISTVFSVWESTYSTRKICLICVVFSIRKSFSWAGGRVHLESCQPFASEWCSKCGRRPTQQHCGSQRCSHAKGLSDAFVSLFCPYVEGVSKLFTLHLSLLQAPKQKKHRSSLERSHETYRLLRRKNLIVEAVHNFKIIEGLFPSVGLQ